MSTKPVYKIEINIDGESSFLKDSEGGITISLPISFKRYRGQQRITLPDGATNEPGPWGKQPTSLQSALVKGFTWLQMIESGQASSLSDIARQEKVDNSYVSRMVNLTALAPKIIEAILDDRLPAHITLFDLAVNPPKHWEQQYQRLKIFQ